MASMDAPTVRAAHDPLRVIEGMRMYIDEYGSNVSISPLDINGVTAAYKGILLHTQGKLENTVNWARRYAEELSHLQKDNFRRNELFSQIEEKNSVIQKKKRQLKINLEETQGKLKKARELADKLHEMVEKGEQELKGILPETNELERDVSDLFKVTTLLKQSVNPMIKLRQEADIKFDAAWGKQPQEREKTTYEDNSLEVLGNSDVVDLAKLLVAEENE